MHFIKSLLSAIAVTSVVALPVDDSSSVNLPRDILETRAQITDVTCSGGDTSQAWPKADIKSSYKAGKGNVDSKTGAITAGSKVKTFGGNARITLPSECIPDRNVQLYEYPLKGSETDRVIWAWKKDAQAQIFCLVVTHRGLSDNDFKNCE